MTTSTDTKKYKIIKVGEMYVARTKEEGERNYHEAAASADREKLKTIYESAGYTYMK